MNSIDFLRQIQNINLPLLLTQDVARILKISSDSAGKYMQTLGRNNLVERLCRGKWIVKNSSFDPLQAAEFITSPKESYISLHSALFYHGMIQQIPARIYSVTVDRARVVKTPIGIFSFHHCHPDFFTGYNYLKPYLKIATPEKCLVDYFYFSPSKSRQFNQLPELEIPKKFSWKRAYDYCEQIPSLRTRSLVQSKLREVQNKKPG